MTELEKSMIRAQADLDGFYEHVFDEFSCVVDEEDDVAAVHKTINEGLSRTSKGDPFTFPEDRKVIYLMLCAAQIGIQELGIRATNRLLELEK